MTIAGQSRSSQDRVCRSDDGRWRHAWRVSCERIHDMLVHIRLCFWAKDGPREYMELSPEEAISVGYNLLAEGMEMIGRTDRSRMPVHDQAFIVPRNAAQRFERLRHALAELVDAAGGDAALENGPRTHPL